MLLSIILYILLSLVSIIFILISLPYHYQIRVGYNDNFFYQFKISTALFSFFKHNTEKKPKTIISIFGYNKVLKADTNDKEKKNKNKKEKTKNKSKKSFPINIINIKNIKHLLRFIIKLYDQIKPDLFKIDLLLSFDEPHYNGLALAYYHSLKSRYPNLPISLDIEWQEEVFEGQGKILGKIVPFFILIKLLSFVLSPQSIKILWHFFKKRKVGN